MITKILAAKRAAGSGASTVIAWGREPMPCCGWRQARASARCWWRRPQKSQARKRWMADHLQLRGAVLVDAGAAAKVVARARACCRSA
jgi:glutamate 5-kinase